MKEVPFEEPHEKSDLDNPSDTTPQMHSVDELIPQLRLRK
jgi:hypothetical protein